MNSIDIVTHFDFTMEKIATNETDGRDVIPTWRYFMDYR